MTWFIAAITATILWAVVNLIDDNLLKNVYRSAAFGAVISGLFGFLPSFYLFVTNERIASEPRYVASAIGAGVLTVFFYYFYFRTLDADEPSVAVALNNLSAALVPFLAFMLLSEVLHTSQYIGLAIIILASFVLSLLEIRKFKLSSAIFYATIGAVIYAFAAILSKYAYRGGTFAEIYMWVSFGFGVGGLTFLAFSQKKTEFKKVVKSSKVIILLFLVVAEVVNILAEMTQGYAISAGALSVVKGIEGLQPLFVLVFGIALSPFFPKYFREIKDKRLPKKILCMIVMIVGLFFIYH